MGTPSNFGLCLTLYRVVGLKLRREGRKGELEIEFSTFSYSGYVNELCEVGVV